MYVASHLKKQIFSMHTRDNQCLSFSKGGTEKKKLKIFIIPPASNLLSHVPFCMLIMLKFNVLTEKYKLRLVRTSKDEDRN